MNVLENYKGFDLVQVQYPRRDGSTWDRVQIKYTDQALDLRPSEDVPWYASVRDGYEESTLELVKQAIDRAQENRESFLKQQEATQAQKMAYDEKMKKVSQCFDDLGFTPLAKGKALIHLEGMRKGLFETPALERHQWLEEGLKHGMELDSYEEQAVKDVTNRRWNRMNGDEQEAHTKRVKEAGMKTVYVLGEYILTKTEYLYAKWLSEKLDEQ